MARLTALLCAAILSATFPATAATFTAYPLGPVNSPEASITMSGPIEPGDYERLLTVIQRLREIDVKPVNLSPGGQK
jgi:hypothetical protein